ncbi:protein FD [Juglans microcarpa x Juglans regia]|uniref:protein FD n=1 Tax=Juglans microcarpa x Juglans regia TaxID=2249226 RepID=UPI001B7E19BE|nr:protein FD [Juglans microcarpa x Juglans regia]
MLSSTGGPRESTFNKTLNLNNRGSSSSSSSKSLSSTSATSSPSPFSTSFHQSIRATKTMEEVWKDISLASLPDQETTPRIHERPHPTSNNVILQDFLARPFSKDHTPVSQVSTATETGTLYGSASLVSPPATVLSLHSGSEFHFLDNSDPLRPDSHLQPQSISNISPFGSSFEAFASTTGLPSFGKKRVPESDSSSGDRRHKRMMKNRESAARSRARKQAYTNELELEVAHLMEENAKLRKQQEQLRVAAAAPLPKKHSLHRTSTAPF